MIADRARHAAAAAALSGCLLVAHGTAAGDAAAGARLAAARCVSCHSSTETIHSTLPLLEGQPKADFIAQWRAFRERKRTAPVMVSLADGVERAGCQRPRRTLCGTAAPARRGIVRQRCRPRIG